MRGIKDYFSSSTEYNSVEDINFTDNSVIIYATNLEERSNLFSLPDSTTSDTIKILVTENTNQIITLNEPGGENSYNLRSNKDLISLQDKYDNINVYLDITGLTHSTWAWLVRAMITRKNGNFWVMYSEPVEYKFNDGPFNGQLFDLSERISGIAPLPSYASLTQYTSENSVFMPLLGFEGARFAHIFEDVQPSKKYTFPVFGVPGFRFDFPFYTYQGNKPTLEREGVWKNYRYEKANCPVSIFILGLDLLKEHSDKYLRVALVGTKPHALGAVLLKLAFPSRVDLIYDHPIRKKGRTTGQSKILCYFINPFKEYIKT